MVQDKVANQKPPSARKAREHLRRLSWLTEAQAALGWGIILVLAALLGVIYLTQSSRIATVGRRVQFLQEELNSLHRENATLERNIAEAQSLQRLEQEAIRLGFAQAGPDALEYVIVENFPAITPEPVEPEPTPQPPAETMSEALWLAFQNSITGLMRGESSK